MEYISAFIEGLTLVFQWPAIGYLFLGVFLGIWLGAVPGVGGFTGLILLLPFTYNMEPVPAFALLLGMFAITSTSDTIASVLLGIPGGIRMAKIPDLSAPSLRRFVRDSVQRGDELRTDAWSGYNGIEVMGYKHRVINISDTGDPAHVVMPRGHLFYRLIQQAVDCNPVPRKMITGGRT